MKKLRALLYKQNLRRHVAVLADYSEIFISLLMIVGIIILSLRIASEIKIITLQLIYKSELPNFSKFLSMVFEIVIGIEFVKMLVKHTPASAIEVLVYTIARKLIAEHGSMLEALLSVVSIAILFATRKYLNDPEIYNHELEGDFIVNGGTSLKEVNKRLCSDFDETHGNTIAGFLFNYLKTTGKSPYVGLEIRIGDYIFNIYDMDNDLIRHIKIVPAK